MDEEKVGGVKRGASDTPTSTPVKKPEKKRMLEDDVASKIITTLRQAIERQGVSIETSLNRLRESVDFMHNELTDLKGKVKVNEGKVKNNEEKLQALESRVLELARYKRRLNLRLNGLGETG